MAFNFSPKVVTTGLIFYLDAANFKSYTSGSSTWKDLTNNSNDGTLINGPAYSALNGGSIVFDGSDDYVNLPDKNVSYATGQISVEAFVYPTLASLTWGMPILGQSSNCTNASFGLEWGRIANKFTWFSVNSVAVSSTDLGINTWYHVVGVRRTGGVDLYVNGVLNATTTNSGNGSGASTTLAIGKYVNCGNVSEWNGNMGVVKFYNRALSAEEVLQNYNATKTRFNLI